LTADKTEFYKKKLNYRNLPNSLFVSRNILSIPFHNSLKPKNIKYISNCIKKFFKGI
jgi:dTDP-4-amino-4,6-dideoxygalactose transaminase